MLTVVVVEVLLLVAALGYALLSADRQPRRAGRRAAELERREAANWRGSIYVNRDNPALFVPKRGGLGWTLNFGHPLSWVSIGALIGIPVLTAVLVSVLNPE